MATVPCVSLSANGSSILPNSVIWLKCRAIMPSNASERPESPSATMAAVRLPFRKKYAKNGMTKMRNTDMAFGTVKF